MAKFLHVGFNFADRQISEDKLKILFDTAIDWVRYAPNCWILWTTSDVDTWYKYIKANIDERDNVFICELEITNRQGWLPKSIWDWIKKERN